MGRGNKFFAHKIKTEHGEFDSKLEFSRYLFLLDLQKNGEIMNLRRQIRYEIIPKQTRFVTKHLKTKDKIVEVCLEKPAYYTADFVYEKIEGDGAVTIIEDTKSEYTRREKDYVLRRKLMALRGTPIVEILKATEKLW